MPYDRYPSKNNYHANKDPNEYCIIILFYVSTRVCWLQNSCICAFFFLGIFKQLGRPLCLSLSLCLSFSSGRQFLCLKNWDSDLHAWSWNETKRNGNKNQNKTKQNLDKQNNKFQNLFLFFLQFDSNGSCFFVVVETNRGRSWGRSLSG